MQSSVFPAFITDEFRPGGGFASFEQQARAAADRTRRQFETSFSEIQSIASRALTMPRNAAGSLDLGVGNYRAAAAAADAHAVALREVATAAARAARSNNDTTEATRLYVQAARAAAIEAEMQARASNQQVVAMERVQTELNQTASRTTAVIGANRMLIGSQDAYSNSARASRFAMVQVGQQLQDVAIQAQMGTSALTILVQQGSQLGFAMSQMTGRAQAFGNFIAGPYGTMIMLGVAAVGFLTTALNRTTEAADLAKHATDGLSTAQGALANLFDLTTGKLLNQSGALREHIDLMRLQIQVTAIQLELEGRRQQQEAARLFREGTEGVSIGESISTLGYRGPGGPTGAYGVIQRAAEEQRTLLRNIQTAQAQADAASTDAARQQAESAMAAARSAAMTAARRPGFGTVGGISADEFIQAILSDQQGRANQRIAELTRQSLENGSVDPALRNRSRDRREREDRRPQQAESSLEQIQRLNEQWDEQPRLVDRAVQSVRELDHILAEAQRRKLPRFDEMRRGAEQAQRSIREGLIRQITEGFDEAPKLIQRAALAIEQLNAAAAQFPEMAPRIAAAGLAVQNALLRPYRDVLENLVQQADQQELIAQGRTAEAQALGLIRQLEEQLGDIGEARRQTIREGTVALEEQARQYDIIRDRQQMYLRASQSVRGAITDIIADPSSALGGLGSITSAFNRLAAEVTTENLFGDLFRRLDDRVTGRDRVREENLNYAQAIGNLRTEIGTLRDAEVQHRQSLDQVIGSLGRFESAIDSAAAHLSRPAAGRAALPGLPVAGTITNTFAQHRARGSAGLDIAGPLNTPITTRASGRVVTVGYDNQSGNYVIIDHGGTIVSSYSHLIRQSPLRQGQAINAGDVVGNRGSTGHSTGSHLHYRVRVNGQDVDPATFRFPEQAATAAAQALATVTDRLPGLREQLASLSDAVPAAAGAIQQVGDAARAAATNDNELPGVTITGRRPTIVDSTIDLDPRQFARLWATETAKRLFGDEFAARFGGIIGNAMEGAMVGSQFGGLLRSAGIRVPSGLAEGAGALLNQIPGFAQAAGQAVPLIAAGMAVNSMLSDLFGVKNHAGGGFGIAGNILINALTPAKRGSATIGGSGSVLGVGSSRGNSRQFVEASTGALESVIGTVERIAEAFGARVNAAAGSVSIGVRDGSYRLDTTGQGITKTKKGAIDFGEDADAAVRAAVLDLIKDGVIEGLRQGTQTLLRAAKDIDSGIQKALDFEGVFTDLRRRLDPVGAALDEVDKHFTHLKDVFEQAGASAEEYAQLEQLYGLERADAIKQAGEAMTSALKGLLDDLTVNNDARSLRDRLAEAHARYDPLAARVAAGDRTVDYDAFATNARLVEALTRQIEGSTSPYFAVLDEITNLTRNALAEQENLISIATARAGPLGGATGAEQTVTAIDRLGGLLVEQLGGELRAINDNIGSLVRLAGGGGAGGVSILDFGDRQNF